MIDKYLGYLMVNSEVNRFFYMSMVGLQVIQLFFMVIDYESLNVVKDVFLLSFVGTVPLTAFLLVIQLTLIILLISNLIMFRRQYRKRTKTKNDIFLLLTKTISYLVIMFRTIFILAINNIVLTTFNQNSSSGVDIGLCSVVYVIYFLTILPITLLTYWNKFCIRKQSITYPYVINVISVMHVYLHFFVIGNVFQTAVLPYINTVFFLLILAVIYWNSPCHYKNSRVITFLYSLLCGMFLVSVANDIINDKIQSFSGCFIFILSSLCIAYLLYHFQQVTVKQLLLNQVPSQQPTKWYQFDRNRHHNQIFLYSLLNYSQNVNNILIFLFEHQSSCTDPDCLSKPIFDKLKQGESKLNLFSEIKQFFLKQVLSQYNPSEFESLGEKEIQKVIHEKGRLSLLIIQLMMVKDQDCVMKENIRKAYYFLKKHEHLIMKSPTDYTFMTKVQIHAMIEILEEEMIQTVKDQALTEKYDLKAQEYFEYQEKLEQFKKEISLVCDLNTSFWSEISQEEPDCKKIKNLISKSHHHSKKVENIFNRLLNSYQRVCIVVYDTLVQFSQLVLNCELSSVFNPFFSLNSKYSQELALWKKEKLDHTDIQFTETYDIPVCMVSADKTDRGNILWENATFRQEYAFMTEIKESTENKTINIDQLILPFYRQQHDRMIDDFSKQQILKFDHGKTVIYKKVEDRNVIEMQDIQIQVVPSLKFGLKLLVFIKKNQENKIEEGEMFMIVDEKLENSLLSQSLINEWSLNNKNNQEINTLIENLFLKNTEWSNLLGDSEQKKILKFDMDQSDYEGNILRILKTEKGLRQFHFQIKNVLIEESPYEKALKANPNAAPCLELFMQNTAKSLDSARLQSNDANEFFSSLQSQMKNNPLSIPFTMTKLTQQKTEQQVSLQKIYQTMSQPTTPRKIITWRVITVIIIVLIMGTMITNMIITSQRQTIYENDINMIEHYNLLIQYIARSMITLREYNFWAFTDVTSSRMQNLQNQLKLYKSMISSLLQSVSGMLTGVWTGYDFRQSGRLINVNETQFVVVANYLLSSITYLADQPPSSMNFPFLDNQFFWYFGMTKSQSNYMNAVYNGLYVALTNMLQTRLTLTSKIENQIMNIPEQLYIFPTIIGIALLIIFIIFSLVIEMKSNKIIAETSKILQSITYRDKKMKMEQIKRFKQMFLSNTFAENHSINQISQKDQSQYQTNTQMIKQETIMSQSEHNMEIISPANTTDRQLRFNKMDDDLDSHKTKRKSPFGRVKFEQKYSQGSKKSPNNFIIPPDIKQHQTVKISVESNNKLTFLFYVCVVMPFLAYFVTIFLGGYYLNSKIMQYIRYGSEMYHLSTFQQYTYLYTRETFLFQNPPTPDFSWGAIVLPGLLTIYDTSRYIQSQFSSIDQSSQFAHTKITLDTANLCNYLYLFQQQSIYYNLTFNKKECEQLGNHIMTKGYKSAFVFFVESSIELLTRNMNPQKLKRDERVTYLTGPELRNMKVMLAYFQQFYKALNKQFQQNIDEIISYYIRLVDIASIILIFSLVLIIKAVNYRWQEMKNESIQVQSILRLISFNQIKQDKCLREKFLEIDCQFYQ